MALHRAGSTVKRARRGKFDQPASGSRAGRSSFRSARGAPASIKGMGLKASRRIAPFGGKSASFVDPTGGTWLRHERRSPKGINPGGAKLLFAGPSS